MTAADIFNTKVPAALVAYPDRARAVNTIYLFKLTGNDGGMWTVDLVSPTPTCVSGDSGKATCTMELSASDFQQILSNPTVAMQLYFQGRLKVSGDIMAAQKIKTLFDLIS